MLPRNFYAYCLVDVAPAAIESVEGIAGVKPTLFLYDEVTAVVSELQESRVTVTRENVSSHQKVIQHVLAQTTPLPFRFGTVVSSAQLVQYVELHKEPVLEALAFVRGSVEMGVKIIFRAPENAEVADVRDDSLLTAGTGPGAQFLISKQRQFAAVQGSMRQAEEIGEWLRQQIEDLLKASSVRIGPTPGLAVAAAHLVERSKLDQYRRRLSDARRERPDLHFLTSGPWPPYSFCDLKLTHYAKSG